MSVNCVKFFYMLNPQPSRAARLYGPWFGLLLTFILMSAHPLFGCTFIEVSRTPRFIVFLPCVPVWAKSPLNRYESAPRKGERLQGL